MEKQKEIDALLNSLDGLTKASPGDFFFTRVQARLQREETSSWGKIAAFLTRPAVALATLSLICLLNAAALIYQHKAPVSSVVAEQFETVSPEDYNTTVAANSYYEENPEPR